VQRRQPTIATGVAAVTGLAAGLGLLVQSNTAIAEVDLGAELTAGYTNNLLRQPEGEDEIPASLGLTGRWVEATRHLAADVDGKVSGIKYFRDTFDDEVVGQLDASLTWWAAPDRLAWVVDNVYGQVATDPFAAISPENRENTNVFATGPDWYIPIGEQMRAYLGGRYGAARYEVTDADNDRWLGIAGIDRAVSSRARLGIQASSESVDFDSRLQTDFDRHEVYARYAMTREQQASGTSRNEHRPRGEMTREQPAGGIQSGLTVNVGYTWLETDLGEDSGPLLEVQYSKALSSSVRLGLELASRFSDASSAFASGGLPGSSPGTDPGVIAQGGAFEERSGLATLDYQRQRTTIGLAVRVADELYETATLDRRRYDVRLTAERRMSRHLTGLAGILWSQNQYEPVGLALEDTDTEYRLELRRELGQRSAIALIGLHASRTSDDPRVEFDESRGYVVFAYSLL
jgi:hypothetical protein